MVFLPTLYFLGFVNIILVIFGFIDLGLGLWTWLALRLDRSKK